MRLMLVIFAFVTLLIVDYARFNGYYTGQVGTLVQRSLGKYMR